jgi:RNA polymerase sigma-70 factor (ECF subfamily)
LAANDFTTAALLQRIAADDSTAVAELVGLYRPKVRRMVAVRMDRRLKTRVDPSDVVQETLLEAVHQLPTFARRQPVPFFPWLRSIAMNRLIDHHRRHVRTQRRSVLREEKIVCLPLPDESAVELAQRLTYGGSSPSRQLESHERCERIRNTIEQLEQDDREVLVLKYLEELTAAEIAAVLGVAERTVWRRHARAIELLGQVLERER